MGERKLAFVSRMIENFRPTAISHSISRQNINLFGLLPAFGLTAGVRCSTLHRVMTATKRVLFVCTGNTCRSPMAEAMFRKAVNGRADYSVKSAGVAASKGSSCSRETAVVCDRLKAPLAGFVSQPVSVALLDEATHIFAMTRGHLAALEKRFPEHSEKFYLVCEFIDLPGKGIGADVPDPIGMGKRAYDEVAKVLDRAIPAIIGYIDGTQSKS